MSDEQLRLLIKATRENKIYDYLAENTWQLSRETVERIAKELAYAFYSMSKQFKDFELVTNELIDEWENQFGN